MPTTAPTDRSARTAELLDDLHAGVADLIAGDDWTRWLDIASRFHRYSFNNTLLILLQRPDATRVAGYQRWRSLGRQVRRGEHGIRILAPCRRTRTTTDEHTGEETTTSRIAGFTTATVFDIAQTEGDPLPDVAPRLVEGHAPSLLRHQLAGLIRGDGYDFTIAPMPEQHPNANGITDHGARAVTVRPDLPAAQEAKTTAHELAHVRLHPPACTVDRATAELEAESVAYLVLAAHGIATDSYSFPYLAGWANGDTAAVIAAGSRALDCARRILDDLGTPLDDGTA